MRRISTAPGSNPPSQGEQGSQDSPPRDPLPVLRDATRNLSGIISNSSVADSPGVAASMFKKFYPTPIEDLACGACKIPRTSRGEYPKTIN